ncbi:MAG TPA: glutamate formimidoyltransferase [Actinomycetota bacterium]|nr:glutamate formimidoyltransferase [Actinomycetota bacterium]
MSPDPLIACVPNFSEGRRRDVIDAILRALEVPGARVVYRQWDPEHNRLDATVIGPPDAVRASALAGAAAAVRLIDMNEHRGGHPRMGAVDVIPFMPVRDVSMDECVELARSFARELAETLNLPVYCYDRAAFTEERRSLAEVRKGEYEGLREAVARGERLPDFGPHEIGKAGATAVGARKPLIAFNVYLSGTDEAAAKEIARSVRESSGGLPAVRAIGFAVPERGCVTVSMNLVDYEVTGIRAAFDAVRAEAARRGMEVLASEIVGLVPQAAITEDDVAELRLEGFDADRQILERLVSAGKGIRGERLEEFLEAVASDRPTPGGGAVAAVSGAAGAALVEMVANLTLGRTGHEEVWDRMREVAAAASGARAAFLQLADRDTAAFDRVMAAFKLPKETDDQRAERSLAIREAYREAADVPLEVARRAADLMEAAAECVRIGNVNAASDALSAVHELLAAVGCAIANVEINLPGIKDETRAARMRSEVGAIRARAREWSETAELAFATRVG